MKDDDDDQGVCGWWVGGKVNPPQRKGKSEA